MSHRACVLLAIRGARAHCSPGAPRQVLGWHLLRDRWGLHAALGIEAPVLRAWLAFVASAYGAGALYHSATHAADVLQSVHFVLLVTPHHLHLHILPADPRSGAAGGGRGSLAVFAAIARLGYGPTARLRRRMTPAGEGGAYLPSAGEPKPAALSSR